MKRESFERVVRSCCRFLDRDEVVVIGSQALFAAMNELPEAGAVSMEVDVLLPSEADRDEVAALFGELSAFHETYGVYADPVDITTGRFPEGWIDRLVNVQVADESRGRIYRARCAELHDLVVAKLVAGRDKDRELIAPLLASGMIDSAIVIERLKATALSEEERIAVASRLRRWSSA